MSILSIKLILILQYCKSIKQSWVHFYKIFTNVHAMPMQVSWASVLSALWLTEIASIISARYSWHNSKVIYCQKRTSLHSSSLEYMWWWFFVFCWFVKDMEDIALFRIGCNILGSSSQIYRQPILLHEKVKFWNTQKMSCKHYHNQT